MDKLRMKSLDAVDGNVAKIAALFPHCVAERKGKDGTAELAIDFDKLRAELSKDVLEEGEERYQFTWPDKRAASRLANTAIDKTLRPDLEASKDFWNTENLYIEGDNLDVLKVLRENYLGKIKMIYIDPPYNTGNDFVYNDDFAQGKEDFEATSGLFDEDGNQVLDPMQRNTESNGRFHTDWLNLIYPRLKVARDLLTNDGVIFISIDENECENLRKVCDEIFGERNLVAQIPWQSRASIQNDTDFSVNHEYIVVYAKIRRQENRRLKESNQKLWYNRDSFVCQPLPLDKSKFDNPDNDPRGLWKADPFDAPNIRPNLTYPITNPNTGIQHLPPRGRCWRTDSCQFSSALADDRIVWGSDGNGRPQLKVFYEEKKAFGSVDNSWFSAERVGTATNGTKELMKLFEGAKYFDTPKPVSLMVKLLNLANLRDGDIILDFFSGSGTTAHAAFQHNVLEESKCKFIMVQLPEVTDEKSEARKAGYENICQIGEERIRRAGEKVKEEAGDKAKDLDVGFRVLKLDSSNMEDVFYTPEEFNEQHLFNYVDNVKSDRTPLDLLFQVLPELGIELSAKIEERDVNGKKVFFVDGTYLIATFDTEVNESTVTEIAKMKPQYFVMRDASAANDNVLDNFEQIFKHYSPDTIRKIL
ncbi:MAG: site-specific DNA-methyltransferase [Bacteroidales bacterium]|nr:site-specific DNA-methyltransferase [Bacteroidales bacterium]